MSDPLGWLFAIVGFCIAYMILDMLAFWVPRIWRWFK